MFERTLLLAQAERAGSLWLIIAVVAGLILLVILAVLAKFFNLWLQSYLTGAGIGMFQLIGMRLRNVNPSIIVRAKIMATQAGLAVETKAMEAHYLAGGNVPAVIRALIAADRADLDLSYKRATAIDLAGRNVLDAVQTSVNPKVIDAPDPRSTGGRTTIDAIAKDGVQLKVKARVTVRACLERLVGGATEETIIARVGEGIVSAIGSSITHKDVLENPDRISKTVLAKGLDTQTAFEILSIDIADVDVGENIGARLQREQAEADMKMRQAEAEGKRAMARAREQEMKALTQENQAKVVLAEAEVPLAIAHAFREGRLGIMDYYNLRNIQADTEMRRAISGAPGATPTGHEPEEPHR